MGRQDPKVLVEDAMGDTVGDKWERAGVPLEGTMGKTVGDNWETAGTEVGDRGGRVEQGFKVPDGRQAGRQAECRRLRWETKGGQVLKVPCG